MITLAPVNSAGSARYGMLWIDVQEAEGQRDRRNGIPRRRLSHAQILCNQGTHDRDYARKRHIPWQYVYRESTWVRTHPSLLARHPVVKNKAAPKLSRHNVIHAGMRAKKYADPIRLSVCGLLRIPEEIPELPHIEAPPCVFVALPVLSHPVEKR